MAELTEADLRGMVETAYQREGFYWHAAPTSAAETAVFAAMREVEARAFERGRAAGREEAAAIADEYHVFETSPAIIASRIRSLPTPPLSKREGAGDA